MQKTVLVKSIPDLTLATIRVLGIKVKGKTIHRPDALTKLFDISRLLRLAGFGHTVYTGAQR